MSGKEIKNGFRTLPSVGSAEAKRTSEVSRGAQEKTAEELR